ncbi:MAG TPA: zinc-ribbon domain-containing protein, partial [Candidatus Acidoferrales bacterium]|nr:zinc-ribbon domain-containing protein [Candidatus Acidoferrales bacterium]
MAHCTKCGAVIAENASFCASCGSPQSAPGGAPSAAPNAPPAGSAGQTQMAENVAGLLCYVVGWITGLIFFFIDKRPYVRFHAAQSIVVFGGLHILQIVLGMFFGFSLFMGGLGGFSMAWALYGLVGLAVFVLWILLMIKA